MSFNILPKFSFRRRDGEFKHIAHGFIPAASIAPKPAVPRTPPPRSPNPSPERPRSALAAAILSSSLTGRTFAIPPARPRSLSESERSQSLTFEPDASTALYARDRWSKRLSHCPSEPTVGHSEESEDEEEDQEELEEVLEDKEKEEHVYQTLDRRENCPTTEPTYVLPLKHKRPIESEGEETDDPAFPCPPLPQESEERVQTPQKPTPSLQKRRLSSGRGSMASPDVTKATNSPSPRASRSLTKKKKETESEASEAFREVLEVQREMVRSLTEQNTSLANERRLLQEKLHHLERDCSPGRAPTGVLTELQTLRQQAQELVDENDTLKMTVHRLNVELSRYQTRFRPLSKQESSRIKGLPLKGSAPPWLVDMKNLSPLLVAYEDTIRNQDALLQDAQEELRRLGASAEEVVRENQAMHEERSKTETVSLQDWKQLQEQADLVLQENQILMDQLEQQEAKAQSNQNRHYEEVSKLAKQLMLLEQEKQDLQEELEERRMEVKVLRNRQENTVTWEEHCSIAGKLQRQLQQEEGRKQLEVEELLFKVSVLKEENNSLSEEKTILTSNIRLMKTQLETSRQAYRKAQRRIDVLKDQMEECVRNELKAHHFLNSVLALAEKTSKERDELILLASTLEQYKQGVLGRVLEGTVQIGKLGEKVKVYRKRASAGLQALDKRLREQEEDFAGRAASYQREILYLHQLLGDRQHTVQRLLQHRRKVEEELEVVWQAATRENQRMKETLQSTSPSCPLQPPEEFTVSPLLHLDATWWPPLSTGPLGLQRSPMFESDSDQNQNNSSDESEKQGLEFYS
ncbi:centrosomal protein of 89 kDa [Lampris incognitus]|uniref:centrosomal protein of 89 kDa n=1 Tax=Lampris incognitus TaxID=2546036 RepID=UPI0024B4FF45|nr:centrosomal protein of 89 kDa [Lampris incognitus]